MNRTARSGTAPSAAGVLVPAHDEAGTITAFARQDSALLSVLAEANALLIRPPDDPPRARGAAVEYLPLW